MQPNLDSKRVITIFRSKQGRSAEQPVHIRSKFVSKSYPIWNISLPESERSRSYRHKNSAEPVGSSVNRRAIRYGFQGPPMIDPVGEVGAIRICGAILIEFILLLVNNSYKKSNQNR